MNAQAGCRAAMREALTGLTARQQEAQTKSRAGAGDKNKKEGDDFLAFDMILGEECGWSACGSQIEAAVFLAGCGDLRRAVAFGEHHQRASVSLEEFDVTIHAAGGGGAERA